MSNHQAPKLWETITGSAQATEHSFLMVESVERVSTRTKETFRFEYLRLPNWVNVIATTATGRIVLVRQYRAGIDGLVVELPAGAVESGESDQEAAERELLEETGYAGKRAQFLGRTWPNPAIQTNTLSTWLVQDAKPVRSPSPEPGEDIVVLEVPWPILQEKIRSGSISSALSLAALQLLSLQATDLSLLIKSK